MAMLIPLAIVVISNTFYHIFARSAPQNVNTFATLTVSYAVASLFSLALLIATQACSRAPLFSELRRVNFDSIALSIAIVGIETGFLYMYKAGWSVGTGQIVSSAILAVVLIFVGYFMFKENINLSKIAGAAICMVGLYFISK